MIITAEPFATHRAQAQSLRAIFTKTRKTRTILAVGYTGGMRRDDVIACLKGTEVTLRELGVAALYLFGSHARDEAQSDSDIDVFVDPLPGTDLSFLPFMGAYETILKAFGKGMQVGYSTRDGLSPYIRADVEREAMRIF